MCSHDNNLENLSDCSMSELQLELKDQQGIENESLLSYLPHLKSDACKRKDADIESWREFCLQQRQEHESKQQERKAREKIVNDMISGRNKLQY
jgi:hypothetical protein